MDIRTNTEGSVLVLELDGRLNSDAAGRLQKRVKALINAPGGHFLFDCKDLSYISSAGLRVLLSTAKTIQKNSGKMVLCGLTSNVLEVFEISGFISILTVSPDRAQALSLFG